MKKAPTILITGAGGFTGQHACMNFIKKGWRTVAAVRTKQHFSLNCCSVECDLTNFEAVRQMIQSVDPQYILHLAGVNSVPQSWDTPLTTMQNNVLGTLNLLEATREHAPKCNILIVGSGLEKTSQPKEPPLHPYGISKTLQRMLSESWHVLFGQHVVIAKPSNLIGPGPSNGVVSLFAKRIANEEQKNKSVELKVNNLRSQREFLDARDAVKAYELLLLKGQPGLTYEIGSGHSVSIQEIINIFQQMTSVKIKVIDQGIKENGVAKMDTANMEKIGWTPKIAFSDSLKDILHYHRSLH
ncbi:GDP-4-dehydro-6-deoxy-D-mannose reductase [Scopulibacillus darangshiensis]|uniref:GDP-4-dehydro-6-deoxy-D-mannose reductase n=1 Tax=Scopulibacillus darangshiensis TaxID=442528 RepID=A0A4R2NQ46_9BACL|nr:NAD-dependent epimerase/dehydratase family protein [Scopulibacillus darangshiensis]TCP23802.1 GDP-4-dehydro-6-deoxy-D-mannose reductase [Scopulibacillus darangshiensis]